MRLAGRYGCLLATLALVALPPDARALIANADHANDICPVTADPCVIQQVVQVVDAAVLDFGTRAVEIRGSGSIDAGAGSFTLQCGNFLVATGSSTGISMKGPGLFGTRGGFGVITARGRCVGDPSVACLNEIDCALQDAGVCDDGGDMTINGRILGNADDPAVIALRAAGDIVVSEQIQSNGTSLDSDGGSIELDAGGSLTVSGRLQVKSGGDGTGGDLDLFGGLDVTVTAVMEATGGDFDGGYFEIDAGRDARVSEDILASSASGEGYGGEVLIDAGRDVVIVGGAANNRILVDTNGHMSIESFGGDGGIQDYYAGRDIRLGEFVLARSNGAEPDGYGESITLDAGRDVLLQGDIESKGRGGFGSGGYFDLAAFRNATISAESRISLSGGDGGGEATIDVFRDLSLAGLIESTTGAASLPGRVDVTSTAGNLTVSGDVIISGGPIAAGGSLAYFEGCEVRFANGASVDNKVSGAGNRVVGRTRIFVDGGAAIASAATNELMYRDAAAPPVLSGSVVPTPTLSVQSDLAACPTCGNGIIENGETCDDGNPSTGDGCTPGCVNEGCLLQTPGFPDVALCDDGKACTIDFCDQDANTCVRQEACADAGSCTLDRCGESGSCLHIPDDSACDDNISCTIDVCPLTGRCRHSADAALCEDLVLCTIDVCAATVGCQFVANHDQCNDGNVCTEDRCLLESDCTFTPIAGTCDDGVACTTDDACGDGECLGVSVCAEGDICDSATGECRETTTSTVQTTTTSTTTTVIVTTTTLRGTTTTVPVTTTLPVTTTTVFVTSTTLAATTTTVPVTTTTIGAGTCGDGAVTAEEQCDAGDALWTPGHSCRDCELLACGDADGNGRLAASDALFSLRAAVRAVTCDCVCDVDGTGAISASDALRLLRKAVGGSVSLDCDCGE